MTRGDNILKYKNIYNNQRHVVTNVEEEKMKLLQKKILINSLKKKNVNMKMNHGTNLIKQIK